MRVLRKTDFRFAFIVFLGKWPSLNDKYFCVEVFEVADNKPESLVPLNWESLLTQLIPYLCSSCSIKYFDLNKDVQIQNT